MLGRQEESLLRAGHESRGCNFAAAAEKNHDPLSPIQATYPFWLCSSIRLLCMAKEFPLSLPTMIDWLLRSGIETRRHIL